MTVRLGTQWAAERVGGRAGVRRHSLFGILALVVFGVGAVVVFAVPRAAQHREARHQAVARVARVALVEALEREVATARSLSSSGADVQSGLERNLGQLNASVDSLARLTAEEHLADNRRSQDTLYGLLALVVVLVPGAVIAGLLVVGGRRSTRAADQLAEQQVQLEEQAMELEQQVQELEVSNTELMESMESERGARDEANAESRERRRNAALLDAALQSSPVGISLLDRDLRYVMVNDAIAQITGIPPAAHVGRSLREVNPLLSHDIEAILRRVVETDEPVRNLEMIRPVGPAGRLRHLLLNAYPIRTTDGASMGLGIAAVDTTEQRELLEQFHHAQKLESVGRLAAGIAHDFNNLLTIICSYCELALLDMPEGVTGRDNIMEIRAAGERAAALSRQMVALSRKQVILPRALDVGDAVRDMKSILHHVTSDNVVLRFAINDLIGIVQIDPTHLEQVVMNLVINAVDAMPDGGEILVTVANVTIDAEGAKRLHGLQPGAHVAITVRDTGTGIDPETMRRIFDPFFTTKEPGKGTGLGLSTVYGIVHDAGGHVKVESEVGAGTTFVVYLPAQLPDASTPGGRALRADVVARAVGAETVMVVEDDHSVRRMLAQVLTQRGYTVLEAAHGGEALRMSSEHTGPIDLVLCDMHMPGMRGHELIDRLHEQRPQMRVVFMSGSSGPPVDSARDQGRGAGPYPFIAKPFTLDALASEVRRALDA